MAKRLSFQQLSKRIARKCYFCDEDNYDVLDCHRILPEKQGGKYKKPNSVACCVCCHRKIHAGQIIIDGYYLSSAGTVLHYYEGNKEFWR